MSTLNKHDINGLIQDLRSHERGEVSDGYHTFNELYEHRNRLFIALCKMYRGTIKDVIRESTTHGFDHTGRLVSTTNESWFTTIPVWRSKKHNDGSEADGWFLLGTSNPAGQQITYHLPIKHWDETEFAETLEVAPEFDGHTSADVLERLKTL